MGWGTRSLVLGAAALAACGRVGFDGLDGDGAPVPTVGFAFPTSLTDEAEATHHVTMSLSVASGSDVAVDVEVAGGTATAGDDFALGSNFVTIPAGATEATVDLTIVADGLEEPDETIELRLASAVNARVGAADHTVTISSDILPRVQFMGMQSAAQEDAGPQAFAVVLDTVAATDVVVAYAVGGTASQGVDHQFAPSQVTIPAGQMMAPLAGAVVDDDLDEDDETIKLTLNAQMGAVIGMVDQHVHTILDQDPPPTVRFSLDSHESVEGGPMDSGMQIELSGPSGKTVSVDLNIAGGTASPADFVIPIAPIVFLPGETTHAIHPTALDDTLDEDDETVQLELANPVNATLTANNSHVWTIHDNDDPPTLAWGAVAVMTAENVSFSAPVNLSAASGKTIQFMVTTATGTASAMDFSVPAGPYLIPAGSTSVAVPVTLVNDTIPEGNETFTLGLTAPTNATIGAPSTETVTIVDDDLGVHFNPAENDGSAPEGSGGGTTLYTYTVVLSAAAASPVQVDYTVSGTAGGTDFTITAPPLMFAAGQTTRTIQVAVVKDNINEADETVVITLTSAMGATIIAPSTRTHTIVNDD